MCIRDRDYRDTLRKFDGVLLTGSLSNVYPEFYNKDKIVEPLDIDRDKTVLPMIDFIFQNEIPMLAICRGFQEVNVAMGGSLFADIHEVPGRMDHRYTAGSFRNSFNIIGSRCVISSVQLLFLNYICKNCNKWLILGVHKRN